MSVSPALAAPSFLRRLALRCGVIYVALYFLPAPISDVPYLELLFGWHFELWDVLVTRVSALLHVELVARPAGSGDTTWNWIQVASIAAIALTGGFAWALAFAPRDDSRMAGTLRHYLRVVLATALVSYGMAKVFPTQFPSSEPELLLVSYGESSPMGLLWRFMEFSPVYAGFCGLLETLAGLALLFRRTALLGALLGAAVMFHVVLLNFCFDVPVKLYASHLFAVCVALAWIDRQRAFALLASSSAVPALPRPSAWRASWLERARPWIAPAYAVILLALHAADGLAFAREWRGMSTPLQGLYLVDSFEHADASDAASERAWDWFAIGRVGRALVHERGFVARQFECATDAGAHSLTWHERGLTGAPPVVWSYELARDAGVERLVLRGEFDGERVTVNARRIEIPRMQLRERGFHAVTESSWNR